MAQKAILGMDMIDMDTARADQYIDQGKECKLPVSHEGGGTAMGPYGNLEPPTIMSVDRQVGTFVKVGTGTVPDSVKFQNNNPQFLLKKAQEREASRRARERQMASSAESAERDPSSEAPMQPMLLETPVTSPRAPEPPVAEPDTELPLFQGAGTSDTMTDAGGLPESVIEKVADELVSPLVDTPSAPESIEVVRVHTDAGVFPVIYDKVDVGPDTVACISSGEVQFSPSISSEGMLVEIRGEKLTIKHTGNVFRIPGTDKIMTVFTRG
jgi:hypothetical protein